MRFLKQLLALTALTATAAVSAQERIVLTGTQATFSLASALAANTSIKVVNVPADGREMSVLKDYIDRRMDRLAPTFAAADAVISLTNALPGDPLYRFAREANIDIVDIEAAIPWSFSMPGVALTATPVSTVDWGSEPDPPETDTAPYFWLSIPNAIRMADIVAHDLAALYPDAADPISLNLDTLKRSLLELRSQYQNRLIALDDDTVFSLTSDFVYLTSDLGIYVDGYFIKQDIRWTEQDLAALTRYLGERNIRVVIHKWLPSDAIQAAIDAAGARLVVLRSGDSGIVVDDRLDPTGLQQILAGNLEALYTALSDQTPR